MAQRAREDGEVGQEAEGQPLHEGPDAQLDGDWDYKVDLAARSANRAHRTSDAAYESSDEGVALI